MSTAERTGKGVSVLTMAVWVGAFGSASLMAQARERNRLELVTGEASLGEKRFNRSTGAPIVSEDGKHVAYIARPPGVYRQGDIAVRAVLDGVPGKSYGDVRGMVLSPDGKRLAYVAWLPNKGAFAVVDGVEGKGYPGVWRLFFSPDGKRVVYEATRDYGRRFVVVDGVESGEYDKIALSEHYPNNPSIIFSANGDRYAYLAYRGRKHVVFVQGLGEREYDFAEEPLFSPDGKRVAYLACRGSSDRFSEIVLRRIDFVSENVRQFVVADGVEGAEYYQVRGLTYSRDGKDLMYFASQRIDHSRVEDFLVVNQRAEKNTYHRKSTSGPANCTVSPDRTRIAYVESRPGLKVLIVDGREAATYDCDNLAVVFSPDSKRLACVVQRVGSGLVAVDGREGDAYEWVGRITFTPCSRRVAYEARLAGRRFLVVEGLDSKGYDEIEKPVFSAYGARVAYVAKNRRPRDEWGKSEIYRALKVPPCDWFVVVDGRESEQYDLAGGVVFSSDGKRVAFRACRRGKSFVVVDGAQWREYDHVENPVFSPDGSRVAHVGVRGGTGPGLQGGKWCVVVDGVEGVEYDRIWGLVFGPDGKHVAHWARSAARCYVVVDGVRGREYDGVLEGSKLVFDGPNLLRGLAFRGPEFLRLDIDIKE